MIRRLLFSAIVAMSAALGANPTGPVMQINRIGPIIGQTKVVLNGGLTFQNNPDRVAFATELGIAGGVTGVLSVNGLNGAVTLGAGDLTTGTLGDARLSSNVPLKNAANTYSAAGNVFTHGLTIDTITGGTDLLVDGDGSINLANTGTFNLANQSGINIGGAGNIEIFSAGSLDISGVTSVNISAGSPLNVNETATFTGTVILSAGVTLNAALDVTGGSITGTLETQAIDARNHQISSGGGTVTTDGGAFDAGGGTLTGIGNGGISFSGTGAADTRTHLSLVVGTNVQAFNSSLAAIAAGTWTGANSITTLGTVTTGTLSTGVTIQLSNVSYTGSLSGSNLTAASVANSKLVNSSVTVNGAIVSLGGTVYVPESNAYFGAGVDGNSTISGALTLTRDMFYNNLTITTGAAINTAGFRIYVNGTLDITAAPAGWLTANATAGTDASSSTAVSGLVAVTGTIAGQAAGPNSTAGATGAATQASSASATSMGGACGANGAGGSGSGGAGGAQRTPSAQTTLLWTRIDQCLLRANALLMAGQAGTGGSGGGGDGTAGGAGGGAPNGPGIVFLWARNVTCTGAAASGIQAKGAKGGNGFAAAAGNRGGGGGAAGSGGGWIYFLCETLTGSATNLFDVSGGAGGNGGNGTGTGTGGDGGGGGSGGRVTKICLALNTVTESDGTGTAGTAGSAHSGTTGGSGQAGATVKFNLP